MRIVVIGGSGHIGTFLIPRLVRAGHEVVTISRGQRSSYADDPAWQQVRQVTADREAEDRDGTFPDRVAALEPDVVIDLICFTLDSATALVERLRGQAGQLLHCGSIWRSGPSVKVPITEDSGTPPIGEYGIAKAAIARMLQEETRSGGLVTTSLHPGHSSAPAGTRSARSATSTPRCGTSCPPVSRSKFPGSARSSCITSTPTMWPRPCDLGGLPAHHRCRRSPGQLGPPRPQPLLQHRQGGHAPRLQPALRTGRSRTGIGALAHRP
jgi:NAD dependent epimerase/dehydratase family